MSEYRGEIDLRYPTGAHPVIPSASDQPRMGAVYHRAKRASEQPHVGFEWLRVVRSLGSQRFRGNLDLSMSTLTGGWHSFFDAIITHISRSERFRWAVSPTFAGTGYSGRIWSR